MPGTLLEAVKNEMSISKSPLASITGLAPIDKIILAVIGVGGMGAIALIAATGIYKAQPLSSLNATKGFSNARKMVKGSKILWDMIEPILRNWKPALKEKFWIIDQAFDFIQGFMDHKEIGSIFHSDDEY